MINETNLRRLAFWKRTELEGVETNNIGSLLAEKGDHELALESYAAAKAVYEAIGAKNMVSQVNKNVVVAKAALRDGGAKL
jgi:hypothetical protein